MNLTGPFITLMVQLWPGYLCVNGRLGADGHIRREHYSRGSVEQNKGYHMLNLLRKLMAVWPTTCYSSKFSYNKVLSTVILMSWETLSHSRSPRAKMSHLPSFTTTSNRSWGAVFAMLRVHWEPEGTVLLCCYSVAWVKTSLWHFGQ